MVFWRVDPATILSVIDIDGFHGSGCDKAASHSFHGSRPLPLALHHNRRPLEEFRLHNPFVGMRRTLESELRAVASAGVIGDAL